jgi:hypothetical protein
VLWPLAPVAILAAFFALGLLLALLVRLTPGLKRAIKLAKLIVHACCSRAGKALRLSKEMEWKLRARYGNEQEKVAYALLLKRASGE